MPCKPAPVTISPFFRVAAARYTHNPSRAFIEGAHVGRLSHIDDIEKKNAEQQQRSDGAAPSLSELYQATPAASQSHDANIKGERDGRSGHTKAQGLQGGARPSGVDGSRMNRPDKAATAQGEADFHGLNDIEKTSGGHLALIVLSVAILVAIIFYIFNYMS